MRGTYNTETQTLKLYEGNNLLHNYYLPDSSQIPINEWEAIDLNLEDEELNILDRVDGSAEKLELTFV